MKVGWADGEVPLWAVAGFQVFASWLAIRVALWGAERWGLHDMPNTRSMHRRPVPRLGGAAFGAVFLGGVLFWLSAEPSLQCWHAAWIAALGIYVLGLLDDLRPLPSWLRLLIQGAMAFVAVRHDAALLGFSPTFAIACWVVWIVGVTNIFNFMDGLDGLAAIQAVVAAAFWSAVLPPGAGLAVVAVCALAAALAFLTFNFPPARIFMGDAGSTLFGFLFAVMPLVVARQPDVAGGPLPWMIAGALALWPFLLDASLTLVRRGLRGENVFQAHRTHFYQRLACAGAPAAQVSMLYGMAAMGGALLAWGWRMQKVWGGVSGALVLGVAILGLQRIRRSALRGD